MKISVKELRTKNAEKEAEKVVEETEKNLSDMRSVWMSFMRVCIVLTTLFILVGILPPISCFWFWLIMLCSESVYFIIVYYCYKKDISKILDKEFANLMEITKKYHLDNNGTRKILENRANSSKIEKSFNIVFSVEGILIVITAIIAILAP